MVSSNLIERRSFLMGLGAFVLAEYGASRRVGSAAPLASRANEARRQEAGDGSPRTSTWNPVFPWERTYLGSVPQGAAGTVYLRGTWGPLSWPEAPDALIVAHPIVQLTGLDAGRELRRIRWTGNAIRIPPGEACEIFVLSTFWNERAAHVRGAHRADVATVEARLSIFPSSGSV